MNETTLKYIATKVKQLKDRKDCSTILFLGAGASVTADIPSSEGIISYLESTYPYKTFIEESNVTRGYTSYMNCLTDLDRKDLLKGWIDKAKINATHLYAAQLVAEGYVDCIVTTNFDPLIVRGLALFNIFPAIYDLAITKDTITADFEYPAVIYFHGQSHGFWQLNTQDELELPATAIRNTILKISHSRTWIVIGYGGTDPVIDQLAAINKFGQGLFWVGYEDNLPGKNVIDKLLAVNTKGTSYLKGYNSDSFFRSLKNELKLGEPKIVQKPFTHLLESVENIKPVTIKDQTIDLCKETKEWIKAAIKGFEEQKGFEEVGVTKERISKEELLKKIKEIYNNDRYDGLQTIESELKASSDEEIFKYYSYVYNSWGIALYEIAKTKSGEDAEKLFKDSIEKYKKAVEIKDDLHEAHYNWGLSLYEIAKMKEGDEAEKLFKECFTRYKRAVEIKNDFHEAFYNWGLALYDLALDKEGEESENLLNESIEKSRRAVEIDHDFYEAFNCWSIALYNLALKKEGEESERLFNESIDKSKKAIEIKNDYPEAYYNCSIEFYDLALRKEGEESERLLKESIEKSNKAIEFKNNYTEAFNSCGNALYMLASKKKEDESENLLKESIDKYKRAVEIDNGFHQGFNNWVLALAELVKKKGSEQLKNLLNNAVDYYLNVEKFYKGTRAYNLSCLYSLLQDKESSIKWFDIALQNGTVTKENIGNANLDFIRTDPKFNILVDKYKPAKK